MDDEDDENDEVERTDVWDEDALRKAGLGHIVDGAGTKAATAGDGSKGPSIVVSDDPSSPSLPVTKPASAQQPRTATQQAATPSVGMSWPITIFLAVLLGGAVYALITFLK